MLHVYRLLTAYYVYCVRFRDSILTEVALSRYCKVLDIWNLIVMNEIQINDKRIHFAMSIFYSALENLEVFKTKHTQYTVVKIVKNLQ